MSNVVWVPAVEVLLDGRSEGDLFTCPICGQREVRLYGSIFSEQQVAVQRNSDEEDVVFIPRDTIPTEEVELESDSMYAECRTCRTVWSNDSLDHWSGEALELSLCPIVQLGVPSEKLHPDVAAKLAALEVDIPEPEDA